MFFFNTSLLSQVPLFAYIDPGTGSFIAQMLIAGFLGFLFMIRSWLYRMWNRLRGKSPVSNDD